MSLCYEYEKWTMITLASVAISLIIGIVTLAYGQVYDEESDFVLEISNASTPNEKFPHFAIEGEGYRAICPSGQCTLVYGDPLFSPPTPNNMGMSYSMNFTLKDNIPNPNVGPKEKEFLEKFNVDMFCLKVDDIIEDNGQEIYTCNHVTSSVTRIFDSIRWFYDTNAIFDAKKNTFKVYGNLGLRVQEAYNECRELNDKSECDAIVENNSRENEIIHP